VRNYNEDKVSIILNLVLPEGLSDAPQPKCSFFGVYDGHGGSACAEYLRDNLHVKLVREPQFPTDPEKALKSAFRKVEREFLSRCFSDKKEVVERSGSCANVVLIVGDVCYVANVGDSRAVLSSDEGREAVALSRDHKP
jgi:protein phosphatase 2C family protein 2/3